MSFHYGADRSPSPPGFRIQLSPQRITTIIGNIYQEILNSLGGRAQHNGKGRPEGFVQIVQRQILWIPALFILLWFFVLRWGERGVFNDSVATCEWNSWENWPADADPHHLIFIADPQLVDPHTYPGRPWPLSSLTIGFTDKYLKRSYRTLQRTLTPQTIFFLGDLFDGGREWETTGKGGFKYSKEWKGYGTDYWLQEYDRFGRIFFDREQLSGGLLGYGGPEKIVATLPGNHDLGFGAGVQRPVRDRFYTYFGSGNRIDVVANHTFVSLDTVSLSARGQEHALDDIWKPATEFLDHVQEAKARAVQRELRWQQDKPEVLTRQSHTVVNITEVERQPAKSQELTSKVELPTVLLTHVPFYRKPGTPCGPLREKLPPSAPGLDEDEQNAIRVAAGYQYQNVLAPDVTKTIAEKVENIGYVFSGDDHDYCEVVHRGYPSAGAGILETTVKSVSLAMGVRKPGFLLASLWNPIDAGGRPLKKAGEPTIQTHLCLLPDTVGTIIKYALCLGLTLTILLVRAIVLALRKDDPSRPSDPLLPTAERAEKTNDGIPHGRHRAASASSNNVPSPSNGMLSVRTYNARARSVSPSPLGGAVGGYGYSLPQYKPQSPLIEQAGYYGKDEKDDTDEWGYSPGMKRVGDRKPRGFFARLGEEFAWSVGWVALPVLVWYWWLMRN